VRGNGCDLQRFAVSELDDGVDAFAQVFRRQADHGRARDRGVLVERRLDLQAVFEHHHDAASPYALIQWCSVGATEPSE